MRRFERSWDNDNRFFYAGAEWQRWSTPYVLIEFSYGFYLELKLGPFYIGAGWWGPRL